MTDEVLAELIRVGHETRSVEFKGPCRRDDAHNMAVVIRAILAMANLRGGGVVVLGVAERSDKTLDPIGLSHEFEATWLAFDLVCDQVARYADPSVTFDIESRAFANKCFIVITVHEFVDSPIICRQGYTSPADPARGRPGPVEVLQAGAVYVRSKMRPASVAVRDSDHMRELIRLAVRKAIAEYRELSKLEAVSENAEAIYDTELKALNEPTA